MMEIGRDNGILAKIRGEDLSRGLQTLPAAGREQPAERLAVIEVPEHGRVRVTYRLNKSPMRRGAHWFWTPCHAALEPRNSTEQHDPDPAHQQD